MQVLSAPSSPRTFSFVNTAGAVPGKASVARNIARSRSLREPGFLVIVAPYCFSNPLSNQRAGYVCNASHGLFAPCLDEQIFGADEQVSGRRRRHLRSIRLNANAERKGPNSTSSRSANLPRPSTRLGLFRPWQRRTDLWRKRTNLRTGSERLRGVIRLMERWCQMLGVFLRRRK
jgi:hypothetical protein